MVKYLFIAVLLLTSFRPKHDFHASVTQMQYNAAEKTFEVSIRMFTDDLEAALSKENNLKVHLTAKDNHSPLVERYVRRHFAFQNAKKQNKPYQFVGKEQEGDATWVYIEIPFAEPLSGSVLQHNVLMDMFEDQVNLVNLTYQSQKKTLLFKSNQSVHEINW